MSEYWEIVADGLCDEFGLEMDAATRASFAERLRDARDLEGDYTGIYEMTQGGDDQQKQLKDQIKKLEDIIRRLGIRLGVGVDIYRDEINYLVPCGTSHMASASEKI